MNCVSCSEFLKATDSSTNIGNKRMKIGACACKKARKVIPALLVRNYRIPDWCPLGLTSGNSVGCIICGTALANPEADDHCPVCRNKEKKGLV